MRLFDYSERWRRIVTKSRQKFLWLRLCKFPARIIRKHLLNRWIRSEFSIWNTSFYGLGSILQTADFSVHRLDLRRRDPENMLFFSPCTTKPIFLLMVIWDRVQSSSFKEKSIDFFYIPNVILHSTKNVICLSSLRNDKIFWFSSCLLKIWCSTHRISCYSSINYAILWYFIWGLVKNAEREKHRKIQKISLPENLVLLQFDLALVLNKCDCMW